MEQIDKPSEANVGKGREISENVDEWRYARKLKWKEMRKANKSVEERECKRETETREEKIDSGLWKKKTENSKNRRKEEWKTE